MRIAIDSFFIGKRHKVCQDYTYSSEDPVPHIIVCDGCSSSPYTSVGSRVLAHASHLSLQEYASSLWTYASFGFSAVSRSVRSIQSLGITTQCLDSTLLMAIPCEDKSCIRVLVYGDGHIVLKTISDAGEEVVSSLEISFINNAPAYASYLLDPSRQARYNKDCLLSDPSGLVKSWHYYKWPSGTHLRGALQDMSTGSLSTPAFEPVDMLIPLKTKQWTLQSMALCSDGLGSFMNEKTCEAPLLREVESKAIDFKGPGKFVERCLRKMVTNFEKLGFYNQDDVSVAGMTFVHEEGDE